MAYMRDPFYIWGDGERVHFHDTRDYLLDGPSLAIPTPVVEEFVAMYWARMPPKQRDTARSRAATLHRGNFGCDALRVELGLLSVMGEVLARERQQRL